MQPTTHEVTSTRSPVLRVTRYDNVRASLMVIVIGLGIVVSVLAVVWISSRVVDDKPMWIESFDVQINSTPGGLPDGAPDQTYGGLEGPAADIADLQSDPSGEIGLETGDVVEVIEDVSGLTEEGVAQLTPMERRQTANIGKPNDGINETRKGTQNPGRGDGPGPGGGFKREQRWFVRFDEGGTLDEYANQLDFFKIELGAILPEGVLVYLTNLAAAKPSERRVTATEDEKRIYFAHQTPTRRKVDDQLFQKAGIDVSRALVLHFYPPGAEQLLAQAEEAYRDRKAKDIARTFFKVRPNGSGGYEFVVTGQTTIK